MGDQQQQLASDSQFISSQKGKAYECFHFSPNQQ
jgi:hypothetical protein